VGVNVFKSRHRLRSTVSLVLASSTFTVGNLQAQEVGNADQGHKVARAICAECHLVDRLPGEQSPNLIAALTAALRTSHESMPNIIIRGSDLSDVIAYVLSLQKNW